MSHLRLPADLAPARHLVLVNLGTPVAPIPSAVREFLLEFLSDPEVIDLPRWVWQPILRGIVLRTRPQRVAEAYQSIWTVDGSPLRVETEQIAASVRAVVGEDTAIHTAYRYGEPSLATTLAAIRRTNAARVVVVPLYHQQTGATTGTVLSCAQEAARAHGLAGVLECATLDADEPGYLRGLVDRWHEATAGTPAPDHVVMSYHGIPKRYDRRERRQYSSDCERTTAAFLAATGWSADRTTHAYQSKFGPEPWLTPATADVLESLPGRGVRRVAVVTPGFLTDGLETIEEIGIRGRESFEAAGGEELIRVRAVADHPALVRSLAAMVQG